MTFGSFIEPDREAENIENLAERLQIPILSGYKATFDVGGLTGQNRIFDRIVAKLKALNLKYEDQCSAQYYYDIVRSLRDYNGQFDRVVEIGVFMGGSTSFLAGCMEPFEYDLDLVDVNAYHLRFAHERARRLFPESAKRIRLFHGDLPSYVRRVMMKEPGHHSIIHHDGSHTFNDVVKDMASLSYVREQIVAIIAQDTHLRGMPEFMNFVDLALYAVFGSDLKCAPIGACLPEHHPHTSPDQYHGNYMMAGAPEGVVLPMAVNHFRYPHPSISADRFLPSDAPVAGEEPVRDAA